MSRGSGDEDLLRETRKLLNALNEENSELKRQNDAVGEQARSALDTIVVLRQEKESLEKDLKQINLNLMQQLRAKVAHTKELEAKLEDFVRQASTGTSSSSRVVAERDELRSRNESLERSLLDAQTALADQRRTSSEKEKQNQAVIDDLRKSVARCHDEASALRHESSQTVAALQQDLSEARRLLSEKDAALQDFDEESKVHLERSVQERMTLDMRRIVTAESDAAFAHEQLYNIAVFFTKNLGEIQQRVRQLAAVCDEQDMDFGSALEAAKQQQVALRELEEMDGALIQHVLARTGELEQKLAIAQKELGVERDRSAALHTNMSEGAHETKLLDAQLQEVRKQLDRQREEENEMTKLSSSLQAKLSASEADLHSARLEIERLEAALASAKTSHTALAAVHQNLELQYQNDKTKHASLATRKEEHVAALERALELERQQHEEECEALRDEVERLKGQLDAYTATLASALDRYSSTSSQSAHHDRQGSVRSRSHHSSPSVRPLMAAASNALPRQTSAKLPLRDLDGISRGSEWGTSTTASSSPPGTVEQQYENSSLERHLISQMLQAAKSTD